MTEAWRACERILGAATGQYDGEAVTQLEHALQCAHFARAAGAPDHLVVAALLHDVGHLVDGAERMGALGVRAHEEVGARFLAACGLAEPVVELVRGHVEAKRYLARGATYRGRLSEASRRTLELQGGPMRDEEAAAFERDGRFEEKVMLRKLDEVAKQVGLEVAPLASYRELVLAQGRGS